MCPIGFVPLCLSTTASSKTAESADDIRLLGPWPAGHQLPVALPAPGQAWKGPSVLQGVLSVLSSIVALMVPHSHTQYS